MSFSNGDCVAYGQGCAASDPSWPTTGFAGPSFDYCVVTCSGNRLNTYVGLLVNSTTSLVNCYCFTEATAVDTFTVTAANGASCVSCVQNGFTGYSCGVAVRRTTGICGVTVWAVSMYNLDTVLSSATTTSSIASMSQDSAIASSAVLGTTIQAGTTEGTRVPFTDSLPSSSALSAANSGASEGQPSATATATGDGSSALDTIKIVVPVVAGVLSAIAAIFTIRKRWIEARKSREIS